MQCRIKWNTGLWFLLQYSLYYGFLIDCPLYVFCVYCLAFSLIQAQLGSISIQEFGLTQDTAKIFRNGMRISKCMLGKSGMANNQSALWPHFCWTLIVFWSQSGLSEFLCQPSKTGFSALLNSLILAKCFRAKLWENSHYVSKQLEKIGGCAMFIHCTYRQLVALRLISCTGSVKLNITVCFRPDLINCHGERWTHHFQQNRANQPQRAWAGQSV